MADNSILEPLSEYNLKYKEMIKQNSLNYFEELVKESKVDLAENKLLVRKYNENLNVSNKYDKLEKQGRTIKIILTILTVIVFLNALYLIYYGFSCDEVVKSIIGFGLIAIGIILIIIICKKVNKLIEYRRNKKEYYFKEANSYKEKAYLQMESLNNLYTYDIPNKIIESTTPLIKLDSIFDIDKCQYLHEKFKLPDNNDINSSVNYVRSGSIVGNPFVILNTYNTKMQPHTYVGSIVIHWTTTTHTKEGTRTVHHSQTLTASVTKPAPIYYYDTRLIYGCEAAPNLSFGHEPNDIKNKSEKQIQSIVKKGTKQLSKKEERATKNGGSFTMMANNEFEVLFNGDDRDNEVEFRVLFTPLAQKNLLGLMKTKEPYGDDFYFYKKKMLNYIISDHSQKFNYNFDERILYNFDLEDAKNKFVNYISNYFKNLYFELAPLLSIPAYQQFKTREYIYNIPSRSNITSYEHESLANRFDRRHLIHKDSKTDCILKANFEHKVGTSDKIAINAYSYDTIEHVDIIPTLGGDGRMHDVPVHWLEYIPIVRTSYMESKNLHLNKEEYQKTQKNEKFKDFISQYSKNSAIIYKEGLFSVLLNGNLKDEDMDKLNEIFNKEGEI